MHESEREEQTRQHLRSTYQALRWLIVVLGVGLMGVGLLVALHPHWLLELATHTGRFMRLPWSAWLLILFTAGYALLCFIVFIELFLAHHRFQQSEQAAQLEAALHREHFFWKIFAPLPILSLVSFIFLLLYAR